MLRVNLKLLWRQVIKVVAGGPSDKTRGGNLIDALDQLTDSAILPEDLPALLATNKLRGTPKIVGTMAARAALETAGVLTVATSCYVQNTAGVSEANAGVVAPPAVYVVARNATLPATQGFLAYEDGGDTSSVVRCEWVLSTSSAARVATFEAWRDSAVYLPNNTPGYPGPGTVGGPAQVKHLVAGTWQLYEATQDVTVQYDGGDEYLPEPGTPNGAAFWQPISPPALGAPGASAFADLTGDPLDNGQLDALISTLAPLASPVFTGTPTAPTPAAGNNSTRVATTAFVAAALGATLLKPWAARAYAQHEPARVGGGLFVAKAAFASATSPIAYVVGGNAAAQYNWSAEWEVLAFPSARISLDNVGATTPLATVYWNGLCNAYWKLRNGVNNRALVLTSDFPDGTTRRLHVETDSFAGNDFQLSLPAGWTKRIVNGRVLSPSPDKDGHTVYTFTREDTLILITVGGIYQ